MFTAVEVSHADLDEPWPDSNAPKRQAHRYDGRPPREAILAMTDTPGMVPACSTRSGEIAHLKKLEDFGFFLVLQRQSTEPPEGACAHDTQAHALRTTIADALKF